MRHILCHSAKSNALNDEDFKVRNKKNKDAADYFPEKTFNKNIIQNVANFYPSTMRNAKCTSDKDENFK